MPMKPSTPCRKCKAAHNNRNGYCDEHQSLSVGWFKRRSKAKQTRNGSTRRYRKEREAILIRDNYLCQPCKRNGLFVAAVEVDHIVPEAEGGSDEPSNKQGICLYCHKVKTQQESQRGRGGKSLGQ